MKRLSKLLVLALFINCVILYSTIILNADGDFKTELKTFLGHDPSESEVYDYSLMITTLQTSGLNTNAIAGVIGNISCESGGKIYTLEGYYPDSKKTTDGVHYKNFEVGKSYDYGDVKPATYKYDGGGEIGGEGHGIVGWSFGRADNLDNFATSNTDKFGNVTVKHWLINKDNPTWRQHTCHIPNMAGQVAFMAEELSSSYASVKSDMNSAADARACAKIFMEDYEKPATDTLSERQDAASNAVAMISACTGVEGNPGSGGSGGDDNSGDAGAVAEYMATRGYWTEEQLSSFCKLAEIDIQSLYLDGAMRDSLSQAELEGLSNWERNIKNDKMEDGLIAKLRIVTMFFGIILIVWSVLMYLAYWFDRINTFFDLDLLGILTLGKLHMSDTEDECTYRAKNLGKTDKKTVNHRAICTICILGIGFGALVVSGVIYKLLATMINTVLRLLGVVS